MKQLTVVLNGAGTARLTFDIGQLTLLRSDPAQSAEGHFAIADFTVNGVAISNAHATGLILEVTESPSNPSIQIRVVTDSDATAYIMLEATNQIVVEPGKDTTLVYNLCP